MKRRLILVVVLAAVGAAIGLAWWRARQADASDRIVFSGNIELTEVDIAFKTAGRLVELNVREGDRVRKGMTLARLDTEQLQLRRERDRAGVEAARGQAAQLETAIQWQREALESDIAQRRAQLREAQARLDELQAGARPQEIEQARAALDAAKAEAQRAERDWERAQALYKNDDISAAQYDQFRSRFNGAVAARRQAEEKLALVIEGARKEDIAAARALVARAEAALRMAEASRLEVKRRLQELETRKAEIERARAQAGIAQSELDDAVAIAPIAGVVLVKSAEVGEILAAGTTILTIGDIERPWLRGYIPETHLGRVKLGTRVKVTADSFPGKVYWGEVTYISPEAEFTPKQIQTQEERVKLVYRVKVSIDNPNQELKANMPADAEIVLPEAGDSKPG